jgi:hypothetical protein
VDPQGRYPARHLSSGLSRHHCGAPVRRQDRRLEVPRRRLGGDHALAAARLSERIDIDAVDSAGVWAVNDPSATNVAQIVISGTERQTPGALSMAAFGSSHSDAEIAAVANHVTTRFGARDRSSPKRTWPS